MNPRWRLIIAAAAFLGWLGYLGYAAALKSRDPIISQAQNAAAQYVLVAEVKAGPDGKPGQVAKVIETHSADCPLVGSEIFVTNLPGAQGFTHDGQYLLLLTKDPVMLGHSDPGPLTHYTIVGQQRSPGAPLDGVGKPLIYPWTDDVRKQAEHLRR